MSLRVDVQQLSKRYPGSERPVLNNFSMALTPGSLNALVGPSGVGKTTLLNCLSGLDGWQSGSIHLGSHLMNPSDSISSSLFRRQYIGLTFQDPRLLPEFTVLENVLIPMKLDGDWDEAWGKSLLHEVGCEGLADRFPHQLSGGQASRIGLARAMVRKPSLWLLDEPTGNLDPLTADLITSFIQKLHQHLKPTTLIVTHNQTLAQACQHQISLAG
ncbi:MAG: ABC transporter ATP-binding protein [Holophagaceae bacterium]